MMAGYCRYPIYTQSQIYIYIYIDTALVYSVCQQSIVWVQFRGNPLQGEVVRGAETGVRAEGRNEPHALQKQPEGHSHFGRLVVQEKATGVGDLRNSERDNDQLDFILLQRSSRPGLGLVHT